MSYEDRSSVEDIYDFEELEGSFGFMKSGDGIVVFLYPGNMSRDEIDEAIRQFKFKAYNCNTASIAEIDPSVLSTDELGELEDEVNLSELSNKLSGSEKEYATLSEFIFNNVVKKGFNLITINKVDHLIEQVNEYMGVSGIGRQRRLCNVY